MSRRKSHARVNKATNARDKFLSQHYEVCRTARLHRRDQNVAGDRHNISTRQQYVVCLCPSLHYFEAQRMDVTNHICFLPVICLRQHTH